MASSAQVAAKSDVPVEQHALVDNVLKVFGGIRGPLSVVLHNPL